jgi:hypothetical protein
MSKRYRTIRRTTFMSVVCVCARCVCACRQAGVRVGRRACACGCMRACACGCARAGICWCVCVCLGVSVSVCSSVYVHVSLYVSVCGSLFVHVCVCVCISLCVKIFVFLCGCTCLFVHVHEDACIFMQCQLLVPWIWNSLQLAIIDLFPSQLLIPALYLLQALNYTYTVFESSYMIEVFRWVLHRQTNRTNEIAECSMQEKFCFSKIFI